MNDNYMMTLTRLTNVYGVLYNNYYNKTCNAVPIKDKILVLLMSGGSIEVDYKDVKPTTLQRLGDLIRELKETTNIIFTNRSSKYTLGILGVMKDITLVPKAGSSTEASLLVDNDYLLVPTSYKSMRNDKNFILDKNYPILQKLMSLKEQDIVDIVFSVSTFNIGTSSIKVTNLNEFNTAVQTSDEYYARSGNTEGFILLLSDSLAFLATDYISVDSSEKNSDEQRFYLISKESNVKGSKITKIDNPTTVLSLYINM